MECFMEKAIWQGKTIYASDAKDKYEFEKKIRLASANGELQCPDGNCDSPTLKYCHGNKKRPYFAHKHTSDCDYDTYDKNNTQSINDIKSLVYNHLINKGFKADIDVKIFEHQYAHIVIYENDNPYVIEIVQNSVTARKISRIVSRYENHKIPIKFLIIGNETILQNESDYNFIRRFSLNDSDNNELLVINEEGTELYQSRLDKYRYVYYENKLYGYDEIYFEKANFEELTFENAKLTISGFSSRYNDWYTEKQERYKNFIEEKNHIRTSLQIPKTFEFITTPKTKEEPSISVEVDVPKKSKLKPVVLPPIDTSEVKQSKDLSFIEEIFLPPGKDKKISNLFGIWTEEDFIDKLEKVCYRKNEVAFRQLIAKMKTATPAEEELYKRMKEEFEETRRDYHYILETAENNSK